ncbi:hypothetical protein [Streptomyces sp. NPDC002215]|uniref:hypothetical protein n=1 Tax=Streptomyces sp. NPDC002215 TaxID=3154412 RepID=UPI00332D2E61
MTRTHRRIRALRDRLQQSHPANPSLPDRDFVYVVHPKTRLGQARSCVLVLLDVRLDGTKELIVLAGGLR